MKVSLNWAQQFSNVDIKKIGTEKLIEKIGAQLGGIDATEEWGSRFDGMVVVKIIECKPHPNADKLQLCVIDDGGVTPHVKRDSRGYVQLVCGGPNARKDLLTVWIPPGATVPATLGKDPFILETRDIRGEASPGMLATPHELGISEDHAGLIEVIPEEVGKDLARPGTALKKLYSLDDVVVDIENKMFTHRPDLFGILGVARELAGIQQLAFKSPNWYTQKPVFSSKAKGLPFTVDIENPKVVPRFMVVSVDNLTIGPSPMWLQAALTRVGIRPINNVVDVTNFVMHTTGQPMHAFDYHKIKAHSTKGVVIGTRFAQAGEGLTVLGGKKLTLTTEDVVVKTDNQAVDLAGIIGGAETEVDKDTQAILLTLGTFDMYSIRRSSMRHGIFTEAATRYTKGQSPLQNDRVLAYTLELLEQLAGGQPASPIKDTHATLPVPSTVTIDKDFINERLGTNLSLSDIAKLLENVEFQIKTVPADKKRLHIQAPFWRTDIEIPEDVVEEVGRLYGYDNVPLELPKRSVKPAQHNELLDFKKRVRETLSAAGANELLTYTFVHGNLLEKVGQNPKHAFQLANALSPDLQYYRLSLLPSLLEKVHPNLKADRIKGEDNECALYELNPVYAKDFVDNDGLPKEDQRLAFVFAADDKTAQHKYQGAPYYMAVTYLNELLSTFNIQANLKLADQHTPEVSISQAAIAPFDKKRAALVIAHDGTFLGEIGELSAVTKRNLKLPAFTAGFELDVMALAKAGSRQSTYVPLPRYPKVVQDMTLKVPAELSYGELINVLQTALIELKPDNTHAVLGLPRLYQAEDDKTHKNVTLRLWISHYEHTLKAEAVNKLLDELAAQAHEQFSAERI